MLAYFLDSFSPFIFELRPGVGIRWYGFAYVLAFICGYALYRWLAKKGYSELAPEQVGDFITWAAVFGVMLGGRLGYTLFYNLRETLAAPITFFYLWQGGMASHGGILGLVLFTLYYARRHHLSWTGIGDNLVVVAPIGLFFGRCANFINGELYGWPSKAPWAVQFPKEMIEAPDIGEKAVRACAEANLDLTQTPDPRFLTPDGLVEASRHNAHVQEILRGILTPRHPSQIYEALLEGVVLFATLWILRVYTRQPRGVLTGAFFVLYALLRIVGEEFRVPDNGIPLTGPFTRGQFLSLFMILIGAAFIIYGRISKQYKRAQAC